MKGGKAVEPNEVTEMWQEYRRAQQQRRAARLPVRTSEILDLKAKGFDVQPLSDYQFRIDGALDLYPTHRRYHHIGSNTRGNYKNALSTALRFLRGAKKGMDQ